MNDNIVQDFIVILQMHGFNNPIPSRQLELRFNISDREVRQIVNGMRCKTLPIGSDARGYYWCSKQGELVPTIKRLSNSIKSLFDVQKGLLQAQEELKGL